MGEPIFSTKAHVFQIDPDTKKKWVPSSTQAVSVAFYHDSNRQIYRIISIEGTKILINSTIVPGMNFTKTSQKFGQWSDLTAKTVYGLGFSNEQDLAKFIETFDEMKEAASQTILEHKETNGMTESLNISARLTPRDSGLLSTKPSTTQDDPERKVTPSSSPSLSVSGSQSIEQLRYENDRLMVALTQSRANAKKWEVELQTLRNNNLRLNAALMESTTNVEQWKQQLTNLKEENLLLKKKLIDTDQDSGSSDLLHSQLADAKQKLQMFERLVDDRNKELNIYQSRIDDLSRAEIQKQMLEKKVQAVEEENVRMKKDILDLNLELEKAKSVVHGKQDLHSLQQQLSTKIDELYVLNDRLADMLQS